jgi:hypothetical protein
LVTLILSIPPFLHFGMGMCTLSMVYCKYVISFLGLQGLTGKSLL